MSNFVSWEDNRDVSVYVGSKFTYGKDLYVLTILQKVPIFYHFSIKHDLLKCFVIHKMEVVTILVKELVCPSFHTDNINFMS